MNNTLRYAAFAALVLSSQALASPDEEPAQAKEATEQGPSTEAAATAEEIAELMASDVATALTPPTTLAFEPAELEFWAGKAKVAHETLKAQQGDTGTEYDVIIQAGHYNRKTGKTGGTGKYVTEQQVAAFVAQSVRQQLSNTDIRLLIIDADNFSKPLKTKIFLSLHTDSSANPCSVGPSVGIAGGSDRKGMHSIALALAITLGIDPEEFMKDNYTTNLSGYYAYKRVSSSYIEGVLEMSELSCPLQEDNLLGNAAQLSRNLSTAIKFSLR